MPSAGKIKIIGHRGAAGYAPENTLQSFQTAIDLGCDAVELDVHLSKDGVPVVIHDDTTDRTMGRHGLVRDLTVEQLQPVPSLQEVIDLCRGKIQMQIELKVPGTPEPVVELLRKNNINDQVVVASFFPELLREVKRLNPALRCGLLFKKISYRLFPSRLWQLVTSIPLEALGSRPPLLNSGLIRAAHSRGLIVCSYGVNSTAEGERLAAMGVDEICTDYPKLFLPR
jgi:glycerophosphoryl diester phosphodiesterase